MMKPLCLRYKGPADFPARIPGLLEQQGFHVACANTMNDVSAATGEFGYTVSDGSCSVVLTGGPLPNGATGFIVVPNYEGWIWRRAFWQRGRKKALCDVVQTTLVNRGATLWVNYPHP